MLLLKKKSSKREKIHGAWPYLKTVIDHDDAVASNTECVVLVWAQIKFVSPLWQKLKLESTPLERLDSFGSNFPPHPGTFQILHSRSAFCVKFPTPWVRTTVKYPKVAGEGRGMSPLRVERRILQTLNTVSQNICKRIAEKKICSCIILKRINRKFFMLGGCTSLIIQNSILCRC